MADIIRCLRQRDIQFWLHHIAVNAFVILVELDLTLNCFYFQCYNNLLSFKWLIDVC